MMWSISKGTCVPACGRRQYSHPPPARCRTSRFNAASMPWVALIVLLEGEAGLGVHQIDEVTDAEIVLKLDFLGGSQGVILILDGELMHPVEVRLIECYPEQGLGSGAGQVGLLRVDHPGDDCRFRAAGIVVD